MTAEETKGLLLLLGFEQRSKSVFVWPEYKSSDNAVQVFSDRISFSRSTIYLYPHIKPYHFRFELDKAMNNG